MTSNEVRQAPISRRRTLSVLVVALVSTLATAQQPELPPATRTRLEGAISRFMSASGIPGLSVAVVLSGQHVWSKGFGFADLENNVPVTSQTLFRLASVSKPITATYPAPHPFLFQVKIGQYRQRGFPRFQLQNSWAPALRPGSPMSGTVAVSRERAPLSCLPPSNVPGWWF